MQGWDCHVHVFDGTPVAGAHYRPVPRRLEEIEALAAANGSRHLVLVQPSVYGTDNSLLLRALWQSPGRHRGVVVLRGDESADELGDMHAAGVRGVRFNMVSPAGSAREAAAEQLRALAPALRALGWHVQWYVAARELEQLAKWQAETGLAFVLDHLAGMTPSADEHAWTALDRLAAGSWIKLSGWYRLQAEAPYTALLPVVRRVAGLFAGRMVWGSDWPHTSFAPDALPAYESVWQPAVQALGHGAAQDIRNAGARLYKGPMSLRA